MFQNLSVTHIPYGAASFRLSSAEKNCHNGTSSALHILISVDTQLIIYPVISIVIPIRLFSSILSAILFFRILIIFTKSVNNPIVISSSCMYNSSVCSFQKNTYGDEKRGHRLFIGTPVKLCFAVYGSYFMLKRALILAIIDLKKFTSFSNTRLIRPNKPVLLLCLSRMS